MLDFVTNNLSCDFCKEGLLYLDKPGTLNSYFVPETFALSEISELIDKTINEYLLFKCRNCGNSIKYTYKDIEKKIRERLYKDLISMVSIKELKSHDLNFVKKVFVYCGKCRGFDGKGSCPIKIYENCKLKRFPSEL
jgi:hypothetical protein